MSDSGAYPDLQPEGGTGSMYPAAARRRFRVRARRPVPARRAALHVSTARCVVGDVLEGRLRTSKPVARTGRRGPMEVTWFQTRWTDLDGTPVVDEQIVSLFFPNG